MSDIFRITSFVFVALAAFAVFSPGEEVSSPRDFAAAGVFAGTPEADGKKEDRIFTAENALRAGLPALAADLCRRELADKTLSNAERDRLLLALSAAQLARGDYAGAEASLAETVGDSPRKRLRGAFAAIGRGRADEAETLLAGIAPDALPREERPQLFLSRALTASFLGKEADAAAAFSEAENAFPRESERERVRFLRQWASVAAAGGAVPAEELAALKASRDAARGTPVFADAGKLYAVALAKSGDRAGALAALRETVPVPADSAADFALLEGLLAEDPGSEEARAAFLRVIAARPPRSRQAAAFAGLLNGVRSLWNAGKKEEAILAANGVEKSLNALPQDDQVRDLELFTRMRVAHEIGNFRLAETLAEELNSRFPASPFVRDALRLLAGIAMQEQEYRRAVPLLERLRAAEMSPEEAVRTDILIADCNFLSGDYALAADAYARVSEKNALSGDELGVIFFRQADSEIRSGNVAAAAALTDSPFVKNVPAEWTMRAECLVVEALFQEGFRAEAAARAKNFLERADVPPDFRMRVLWVQALLALDEDDPETALRDADLIAETAAELDGNAAENLKKTAPELESRAVLLKSRALFLSGKDAEGLRLLGELRERWPDSASAVVSWLEEGRRFSELGKPSRALVCYETLIERYGAQEKFREYAAVAAFEAAQAAATIGRPEEAVKQMQTLISRYPQSPLVFYARLRQADFFRILNDFDSALAVYDNLIAVESERPEMRVAEMRRADTLRAIAARAESDAVARGVFTDALNKAEAAYERLFSLPDQPLSLKAEAGYKWGYAVAESVPAGGGDDAASAAAREQARERARTIYWKTVSDTLAAARERGSGALDASAGYWLSRCLFALAGSYEEAGDYESARSVYGNILEWSGEGLIPGKSYAEWRLKKILEK